MNREESAEEILSADGLTDVLAEATGTTPEEIKQRAESLEIAPPSEATVVDE